MFCNEPIVNVYTGQSDIFIPEKGKYDNIGHSFLDCYHDIAYHVEPGQCLVLETKSYAIFIDSDGVHFLDAPAKPRSNKEWLDACVIKEPGWADWVHFEQTLFEGEFLLEVWKEDGVYFAKFTDFTLKIIPYKLGQMREGLASYHHWSYHYVLGCDRYIKAKCPGCGGDGEILLTFVSDYIVRCKNCKRSTWAGMCLIDAIEDWNDGDLNCTADNIIIE